MLDELFDRILGGPAKREEVNKIAGTINIPSQPKVMAEINAELAKKNVDFQHISTLVSRDVGMSAKLLKVANSSLYAPKTKIESIDQALLMLGVKQFKQTIFTSALRATLGENAQANQQFWAHSESVGAIAEALAKEFCPSLVEHAYLAGLFHDCAIPILLERGAGYAALAPRALGRDRAVAQEEEAECEVEHGSLVLVMTRSWSLPVEIVRAVRAHHSDDFMSHQNEEVTRLHAILAVADDYLQAINQGPSDLFAQAPDQALQEKVAAALGCPTIKWHDTQALLDARFSTRLPVATQP